MLQDNPEDMQTIDSCEYIWEAGVGFAYSQPINVTYDQHRGEILKLLLTCFSETMYLPPVGLYMFIYDFDYVKHNTVQFIKVSLFEFTIAEAHAKPNQWISYFTSAENRHALPLFTSLLNVTCAYDPIGYGIPYNHLMFNDSREALVEIALQVLCVGLETTGVENLGDDSYGDQVEVG